MDQSTQCQTVTPLLTHGWLWMSAMTSLLLVTSIGCSGKPDPSPKENAQADPPKQKKQVESKQAKASKKEQPISKPLAIRRLKRDPRSVIDKLEDLDVQLSRNSDGNISSATLKTLDDGTVALLARLEDLKELSVGEAEVSKDALDKLFDKVQLRVLEIHGRSINSESLAGLTNQKQLKTLKVSGTRVDDQLLERLSSLDGVEHLELAWSRVTNEGLGHLVECSGMKSLDLSFTEVTDESLESLKKLDGLKTLVVSGTSISEEAGKQLAEALKGARIIGLPSDDPLPPPPADPNEPPPGLIET